MQAGFYLTPIIYPMSVINNITIRKLLLLNPIAQAIQDSRYTAITDETTTITSAWGSRIMYIIPISVSVGVLIFGIFYFRKKSPTFAEDL